MEATPGPSLFFSNYNNDDLKNRNLPELYPTLEPLVTSALLVPKVFRERLFSDLYNHTTLGSMHAQTKPHRLISGVHPDLAGILPHCAANQHRGWDGRARDRAVSSDGAFHSENIRARNEGLFPKTSIVHLTLNTTVCLVAVTGTNTKIMHLPIVLRLPLTMEGLAMYFPSDES